MLNRVVKALADAAPTDRLVTLAFALLAFTLAYYGLVAREKRTPSILHFVHRGAILLVATVLCALVADASKPLSTGTSERFHAAAFMLLVSTGLYLAWQLIRVQHRHVTMRDDPPLLILKQTALVRWLRNILRRFRSKEDYKHNPKPLPSAITSEIESLADQRRDKGGAAPNEPISILSVGSETAGGTRSHVKLAAAFLQNGCCVQYATALEHPIRFVDRVKEEWSAAATRGCELPGWNEVCGRIVVIDAFTPHFGFTDTVHQKQTDELQKQGAHVVVSPPLYAGVHTSAARAFNVIRQVDGHKTRSPVLVIYEGMRALADLESLEQYRVFFRHVLPSERAWGGMVTLVVEPHLEQELIAMLRPYVDLELAAPSNMSGGET